MNKLLLAMVAPMLLAGCTPRIEIAASKEPITINMNVKIEHEIHIKVDKDVENLLKSAGADLTQRARAGVDPERSAAAGAGGGNAERLSGAAAPG